MSSMVMWGADVARVLAEAEELCQDDAVAAMLRSEANENRNSPPSVISDAIGKAVIARRPKTRYAVGFGAKPLIAARGALTDRQFDAVITRATGVPRD